MLDSICTGIAAITNGIQAVADVGKWIFNLNYCFVATVGHYVGKCLAITAHYVGLVKFALATVWSYVSYFAFEIYEFLGSVCILMLKLATHIYEVGSLAYLNTCSACGTVMEFIGNGSLLVKCILVDMYSLFVAGASHSASFVVATVSTALFLVASLGAICVNFIYATWNGLGYALSSVAGFPSFLSQSATKAWRHLVESAAGLLMATTKETYLGVVILCLIYLTLSNFMRFFSCQSLPLFSRRIRRRRHRSPPGGDPLQFDHGFESDFEDMFGSDGEGRDRHQPPWLNDLADRDSDQVDNNSSSDSSDNDISDIDDVNDSDEYTVESDNDEDEDDDNSSDDADSVHSHNSRTFSTGSSEHDIEVQLPPLDQHYGLRSRSSTPARHAGNLVGLNSNEDFTWEMERERDKRKCVVCQDEIKSVLVLPCRHLCMCVRCADQIVRSRIPGRKTCPLCRAKIVKVMNIYV